MPTSENILAETAALNVPEGSRYDHFGKDTLIGHFWRYGIGGTKGNFSKIAQKVGRLRGLENHLGANRIIS